MKREQLSDQWAGASSDGESWKCEIETDRFSTRDPFVVSIFIEYKDGETTESGLATASPEQAREMAACLLRVADNVDFNNARDDVREALNGGDA